MPLSLKKIEKQYYQQLYRNKTILIKISGAEICSPLFSQTIEDIARLMENDMKIIVVFGGGEQIDRHYLKNTGKKDRPKIDGVAVTTPEVLEQGVIPAYRTIETYLKQLVEEKGLTKESCFVLPETVSAKQKSPQWQHTGTVLDIPLKLEKKLVFVGFLGVDNTKNFYNLNADEIVTFLVKQYSIIEVFFVTKTGGILDTHGKIIDFISLRGIGKILAGTHSSVKVDGGMKKKILEIQTLLQYMPKVAVIGLKGIFDEITRLEGSGTLCINLDKAEITPCKNKDLFELVYSYFTKKKMWKQRTDAEKYEVWKHHVLLTVGEGAYGGCSLLQKPYPLNPAIDGISIECWWSGKEKNGIGKFLIDKVILESKRKNMPLFLYTKQDMLKMDTTFICHPDIRSETGAVLWSREC